MSQSLAGRRIIVTGAAKGIGRAITETLTARGAHVAGFDLNAPELPEGARGFACDVADTGAIAQAVTAAVAWLGGLDVLVNNAGVVLEKPLGETTPADFDRVTAINLRGPFFMAQAAVAQFSPSIDGDAPRIINIASELAHLGREEYAVYCASKAGIIGMTRSLARELAPRVLVNAVGPGPTETDMLRAERNFDAWKDTAEGIALGRIGQPADVAGVVAFLCGPDSRFMTGSVVDVNGGAAMY